MAERVIHLPTSSGAIDLYEAKDAGQCSSCKRSGGGMARVEIDHHDKLIRICGNCIDIAVAAHIRGASKEMPQTQSIPIQVDVERTFAYRHGYAAGLRKARVELDGLGVREPLDGADEEPGFRAGLEAALEVVARIPRD